MFGPFKPSASLSGGLLWKIPWRLSPTQKLRQRRRLRRVDNVVTVLSTALRNSKDHTSSSSSSTAAASKPQTSLPSSPTAQASATELAATAEGQRLLASSSNAALEARRHGRGPKQGEFVPTLTAHGVHAAGSTLLRDVARAAGSTALLERWRAEMPAEHEMRPRDKYTLFDKKVRGYRKAVHKLPKWTRVSQRLNPPGF